jgi:hypothetical protein
MKILFLLLLLITSLSAHAQERIAPPQWLVDKMDFYQQSRPDINAQLTKYQGKIAWYIPPRCCDIPSELYDEAGTLICHPDGGLAGSDGKCPSFGRDKE